MDNQKLDAEIKVLTIRCGCYEPDHWLKLTADIDTDGVCRTVWAIDNQGREVVIAGDQLLNLIEWLSALPVLRMKFKVLE